MSSIKFQWPWRRVKAQIEASTGPLKKVEEKKGLTVTKRTWTDERPHPSYLADCESYYTKDGEYFAAVNVLASMSVGIGYYTECENERAKQLVDAMAEEVGLDQIHLEVVTNMLIYGYCPVERYFVRGPPKGKVRLKVLPPKTIWVMMNKKGKLLGYIQKVGGQTVATFKPKEIVFYKNGIGTYGKSIASSIINLFEASEQFHTDMPKIIHKYGSPLIVLVTAGDDKLIKKSFIERDVDEAVFIGSAKPGEDFDMKVVDINPRSTFTDYVKEINESKAEALQAPLLRYLRNATEASATKMLEVIDRRIEGIQRYIKRVDERQIFAPLLALHGISEVPALRWGVPRTGVEDINIDNFLAAGTKIRYITRKQYLDILRQKGLRIEDDEDEEEPPFKKDDDDLPSDDK